jgi:alpha/beta hydrolase fold
LQRVRLKFHWDYFKGERKMVVRKPIGKLKGAENFGLSRRRFLSAASAAAAAGMPLGPAPVGAAIVRTDVAILPPYGSGTLPPGIRSRTVVGVNGLTVHMLEAGYEGPGQLAVLLIHGFPELAYSWRKIMPPLASAGYHVIAPDQRGYGRTTGWDDSYDADPDPFRMLNMVRDAMSLVFALGYREVAAVVGHDAGAPVAAWSALVRPDVFRSVTLMSSPFAGAPNLPFNTANGAAPPPPAQTDDELDAELAKLKTAVDP